MSQNDASDPPIGYDHTTVKPDQLRRDEIRFVVLGDDLLDRVGKNVEIAVARAIEGVLSENYNLDIDEIAVERGRESK